MWRRALLTAAAVSYLICVLILSGIQKEDLDVSMLGKLRRYNVNLDDINNEQIRQQCVSRNNELTKGEIMEIKDSYVSTTEYNPTISTKLLPSQNLNMDSVMSYLKTREDSDRNSDALTRRTISTTQEMVTDVVEVIKNEPKIDMDSLRRFIQLETQKNYFYKIDDDSETAKHDKTFNIKTNQKNSLVTDDAKIIDKLIKDYLLKKQKIPTTTERSTTRFAIDMQKIYKQIDEIIANGTDVDNEKVKHIVNYPDKGEEGTTKHNVISPPVTPLSQLSSYPTGKQFFESFFKFLNEMNQFKNNSSRPFQTNDNNVNHKDTPQKDKLLGPLNQKDQENKTEPTTKKVKSEKEPDKRALTPSLVKEIAETVKNVIIKDLRDELAGIYVKTTQTTTQITSTTIRTTTETFPTSTFKSNIKDNDMAIMDKFMELYEQIKSLKQASYLLKASNESTNLVSKLKRPDKIPREGAMIMPTVNGLQIQEPKVFISSVDNYNTKPVFNYNPYLPRRENNRLPITIQTNSVEIQPLPVPVSKPESMISQNIVVHTGNRYQHKDNFKYLNSRGTKFSRYTDTDNSVNYNRTFNYSPLKRYDGYKSARYPLNLQEPKPIEDVIRFRVRDNGNSRLDTDYYEKINFGNSHNNVKNKHGIFTNQKYPKFHERLERVDPGSDGTPIVSDVDIKNKNEQNLDFPSRHQLSLIDMKKGTSYDDTHFKNFLRSQQKVTDMLERILATRPKNNTPRSVETV